jgi:hypothetical protein
VKGEIVSSKNNRVEYGSIYSRFWLVKNIEKSVEFARSGKGR